jgi:hypothetical protein
MTITIFYLILIPLLWIGYSMLEGTREGYLYAYRDSNDLAYDKDLHLIFSVQRGIMLAATMLPFTAYWYFIPIGIIALAALFPIIHDGFYYITRHRIDSSVYKYGFVSNNNTSTAKISIKSFIQRFYLALIGAIIYGVFAWLVTK